MTTTQIVADLQAEIEDLLRQLDNQGGMLELHRMRVNELERPDFRPMREMLRAMQAGELTVSRGIEILDMWWAGNWSDDMLPPVRQDLIEEDSMPVEIIDRLKAQLAALTEQRDMAVEALKYAVKQVPELGTVPGISAALAAIQSSDGGTK
jgi:muconolactone delta-isomerase